MAKLYDSDEQMAVGDGLCLYLREKYPDHQNIRSFGTIETIQWPEELGPQDMTEYINNKDYYTKRVWDRRCADAREYPSIEDQLDMIYWDKINGTDNWVKTITKIKSNQPKKKEFKEPQPNRFFLPEEIFSNKGGDSNMRKWIQGVLDEYT